MARFVKLTGTGDTISPLWLNPEHVVSLWECQEGETGIETTLNNKDGVPSVNFFTVRGTPEELVALLMEDSTFPEGAR